MRDAHRSATGTAAAPAARFPAALVERFQRLLAEQLHHVGQPTLRAMYGRGPSPRGLRAANDFRSADDQTYLCVL